MSILLFQFWHFVVMCLWGYCLLKNIFFSKWFMFEALWNHLKFTFWCHFYINVTCCRLISLFMLIFFTYFCLGISEEDAVCVKYLLCMICIFLRNTGKYDMWKDRHWILIDVTSSDILVYSTNMVNGIQR